MNCRHHTGVAAVAATAQKVRIWRSTFEQFDIGGIRVVVRHVAWVLVHEHAGDFGWGAVRQDGCGEAVPDAVGWLGPAYLPSGRLLEKP
jgi:hypothetical protein